MAVERPTHPLARWLEEMGISYKEAAKRCKRRGRNTSWKYIEQIANGHYGPGFEFSKFLSTKLTEGAVSALAIYEYPYARKRSAA